MKKNTHLYLACFFLEWEMYLTKVAEKIKTHILCSITFSKNRTAYETMQKLTVQPDRRQMIIWHMHIAYWIPKATNTHSECVIIDFPLQQWCTEWTSMLCYMYFVCLLISFEVNSLDLSFTSFHSIFTECLPKA
jgi:hypothetical protein